MKKKKKLYCVSFRYWCNLCNLNIFLFSYKFKKPFFIVNIIHMLLRNILSCQQVLPAKSYGLGSQKGIKNLIISWSIQNNNKEEKQAP